NRTRVHIACMTPNFSVPACMHPSAVAALALRPSGACQTYQSPPNKVYRRGRRQKGGGRKRGAEGVGSAASLPMGTRARDGGDRQTPGKPHENPMKTPENECETGRNLYPKGRHR